eukprot:260258_1
MANVNIISQIQWITVSVIGLFVLLINGVILHKERTKRKSEKIDFINKSFKTLPLLCIICGTFLGFCMCTQYFDGICYISSQLNVVLFAWQSINMGLYQLSRLYYCFSKNKVYSNHGYPNCLFYVMIIIGICGFITWSIAPWFWTRTPINCYINNKYQGVQMYSASAYHPTTFIGVPTVGIIYLLWDFTTLLLYVAKVRSFRKYKTEQIDVYRRIMAILNKILILTFVYEIMVIFGFFVMVIAATNLQNGAVFVILYAANWGCVTIVYSFSMFLMQEHNVKEYKKFLKLLYDMKLHYICCCCCKSIINHEIQLYFDSEEKK